MENFKELKEIVWQQNLRLKKNDLVILTEGNVSQISQDRKYVAIKPSGVRYEEMQPEDMVIVDLAGNVCEGNLKPSTDTLTHLEVYKKFSHISGIVHTHSPFATMFAQSKKELPCYGTTHADNFHGAVPVTRDLTAVEIAEAYEKNIGKAINEIIGLDTSAVFVGGHAPFIFGLPSCQAVENACVLEKIAMMAILKEHGTFLQQELLEKHYNRKHGSGSYYGQKRNL